MKKLTDIKKLELRRRTVKLLDRDPLLQAVGARSGELCGGGDGSNCCSDDCLRSFVVPC